ncbi:MAG: caspase family protein [Clostridiales bacterium]|nr:caspase family protein [Clostridiales bacterium]
MRWQKGLALLMAFLLLPIFPALAVEETAAPAFPRTSRRALLISCDDFISQQDTGNAAANNVQLLADTLQSDARGYGLIRSFTGRIATVSALERAIRETFAAARPWDTSLIYISTHGIFDEGASNGTAALLLSDGKKEERITAAQLQELLDGIPGEKILILDACNSGAFIGKGLSGGADRIYFAGPDYKVLCSAGGSEASFYWQGVSGEENRGESYFATVLANGLGAMGDHAADANMDGNITLQECYAYIYDNYAASTPQVYPQNAQDFVLYAYDIQQDSDRVKAITGITFEDNLLTAGESEITFSFTVHRQTEVYYQIVYHENGEWQFDKAYHFQDMEQPDGTVSPGRKQRTLSLDTGKGEGYGYAMIQLITLDGGIPVFQGARLLCVQPAEGDIQLSVKTDAAFIPGIGQELCIIAQHDKPCALSVTILDEYGDTVRHLSYAAPSRPQQLSPAGSTFYWDGKMNSGEMAKTGKYRVKIRVRIGEKTFTCESEPFELLMRVLDPQE